MPLQCCLWIQFFIWWSRIKQQFRFCNSLFACENQLLFNLSLHSHKCTYFCIPICAGARAHTHTHTHTHTPSPTDQLHPFPRMIWPPFWTRAKNTGGPISPIVSYMTPNLKSIWFPMQYPTTLLCTIWLTFVSVKSYFEGSNWVPCQARGGHTKIYGHKVMAM